MEQATPPVTVPDEIRADIDAWLRRVGERRSDADRALLARAAGYAARAHDGQVRASGEPYLRHALAVSAILHDLGMDAECVAAAVLHDVVEDTGVDLAQLEADFGAGVARLVDGVTKMTQLGHLPETSIAEGRRVQQAESVRKLLLAMVEDVRVVLIKLADRLHNMRTLKYLDEERRRCIARETLDIYAPLANRLGIWQIKWELEDLSLRFLEPEAYHSIARALDQRREERERYINEVIALLREKLGEAGIEAEVTGRPKHIYSIWRKMQRKNVDFHQIFDVRAVRILVEEVADCYAALGVVHGLWHHIPGEFDDYIANPKENLYRSLHTAVVGPGGQTLEVQIRTREMHEHAELGIAAHWRYKEGVRFDKGFERKIAWMRQLLEWKDETASASEFVDRFKAEAGSERVYVLTPRGQVIDLPKGATPLDFAYHIHTDVGHRCRGARVNGRIVPLTHELRSGDQVEVLTTRQGAPSRDWLSPHLGYLKTSRARAKVRHWFRQQDHEKNVAAGRGILDRELNRLAVQGLSWEALADRLHYKTVEDMLAAIGAGDLTNAQIAGAAQALSQPAEPARPVVRPARRTRGADEEGVHIEGVGNLLTHIARCCRPVPRDPIVGYITRGRGVTIHRRDCPNALRLQATDQERLIEVDWGRSPGTAWPVDIDVLAYDRAGLLRDVTAVLANDRINVLGVNSTTDPMDGMARIRLTVEIGDMAQLSRILSRIGQLRNVVEARRRVG